jgi:hypothetical protein
VGAASQDAQSLGERGKAPAPRVIVQSSIRVGQCQPVLTGHDVPRERRRPLEYFSYNFKHLPIATTIEALEALLPWNLKPVLEVQRKRRG